MIKAVIFDMDGVIVDSEPLHFMVWAEIFRKKFGIKLYKKDFANLFGTSDMHTVHHFLKKYKLKADSEELRLEKKRLFQKIAAKKLKLFPGVKNLIKKLSKKYKLALTSTEWKETIKKDLTKFGLYNYFDVIIGKEDVKRHKPDPEPYIITAKKLGLKRSECVVIEDSVWVLRQQKEQG